MHARVVTLVGGDPTRVDEIVAATRDRFTSGAPEGLDEMRGFWMLVDRQRAQILGVSLFDDRAALQRASKVLEQMPHPAPDAGGRPASIDVYEIPIATNGPPPDSGSPAGAAYAIRTSVFPTVSPRIMRASAAGACSRPSTTVSLPAQSAARAARAPSSRCISSSRSPWLEPRKPRTSRSLATSRKRLLGPGGGSDASYSEIAAADRDPPAPPQRADRGLEVVAADVVEIDVDPVRRGFPQQLGDRPVVVVERRVEPELLEQVRDLLRRARAPDDPVTAELRELGDDAPDRACRRRHPDLVALAQAGHPQEARVRREAVGRRARRGTPAAAVSSTSRRRSVPRPRSASSPAVTTA